MDDDGMFRVETIRFESGELIVDVDDAEGGEREMEEEVDDVAAAEQLESDPQSQEPDDSTMLVD